MAVRVFGCNHIVLEVGDLDKAIEFYTDVFNLEPKSEGEGDAFSNWEITNSLPSFNLMTPMWTITGTSA